MLKETICYSLQCNGCGRILLNKAFKTRNEIEEVMHTNYWRVIDDKHYCPRCYYEENNEIIPKEMNKIGENGIALPYNLVDLGLPSGTLWMDRNIGAREITNYGLYFAWGETEGYTANEVGKAKQFRWSDYKYKKLDKYCNGAIYDNNNHYVDNLIVLEYADDAAYQFTNGKCQMPTREQIQELLDNTTYEWSTMDGVNGGLFTSKINGISIFVPADGCCENSTVWAVDNGGYLWSSSLGKENNSHAWSWCFDSYGVGCENDYRKVGFSVRGVKTF